MTRYVFKTAETGEEFQSLRRLNHRIFAEEVGQHEARPDGVLIDPFEDKSRFTIAVHQGSVVGMVCVHDEPPFSVEKKLSDRAVLESLARPLLEVRLLAIDPEHRNRMVLAGLLGNMVEEAFAAGYGTLLISALADRMEMYERFGFSALGPPVESGSAIFVPMALKLSELPRQMLTDIARWRRRRP